MPRAEVGTPKWLANKMKSKGLQKLRWFCQMCEKQCRDENGFKCHCMSEGHQRQMQVFSQRAHKYMDEFSREFEAVFMQLMRTRYCRTKVLANTVYQDVIADKQHIHMNSTIWVTLSAFVLYLQRNQKINVEETERGFVIEYIDREKIRREQEAEAIKKAYLTAEQRRVKDLHRQVEVAWEGKRKEEASASKKENEVVPFQRDEGAKPIQFNLSVHNTKATIKDKIGIPRDPSETTSSTAAKITEAKINPLLVPSVGSSNPSASSASSSSSSSSLSSLRRAATFLEEGPVRSKIKSEASGKRKMTVLEKLVLEDQLRKKRCS